MRRPNLLICTTDQQRWDALGASDANPDIKTPYLDALAQKSVYFDHYFVQSPVCMPSRVSYLTGQYPGTLGITQIGIPVPSETITLPQILRSFGYRSANIGKLHFLPHANRDHREIHPSYGFDQLEISDEPGCYEDAYRAWVRAKAPDPLDAISCGLPPACQQWQTLMGINDPIVHPEGRGEHVPQVFAASDNLTHSSFVAERTMDYLRVARACPDDPFCLIASFYSPHSPWIAPQKYYDLYDPATFRMPPKETWGDRTETVLRGAHHGYYAMVSEVDDHLGRILAFLDEVGLADNTIIVFTSDHGEWLGGQNGRFGKGYPADDAVTRVPFLLHIPPGVAGKANHTAPRRESRLVEAVQMVPTLLQLAGIPIPPQVQGRSLLEVPPKNGALPSALTEMGDWKALRTPGFRYLCHADGREVLRDLSADSWERYDVASNAAYAETLALHRHILLRRLLERERSLPRAWVY